MHHSFSKSCQRRRAICSVLLFMLSAQVSTSASQQVLPSLSETTSFVTPVRRPAGAVPKGAGPLPATAEQVVPMTLEVVTRIDSAKGPSRSIRQSVSRTRERIHLSGGDGREWLFVRNPVDPHRLSGMLIDHASRTIVMHEESDLRSRIGINGWADALLLGLDPEIVPRLLPTRHTRTIAGVRFTKHTVAAGTPSASEVWWNDAMALPGAFAIKDSSGVTRVSIERIERRVESAYLDLPASRFPSYRLVDLAEWLEVR